eukprot:scaffold15398_cov97-Isochrysis_galbana.AAC.3
MTLNDLGTVKEHQLPIKMAIMNDGAQQVGPAPAFTPPHLPPRARLLAAPIPTPSHRPPALPTT